MAIDPQKGAEQALPNEKDLAVLQQRFSLVSLEHPVYGALFNFAADKLPRAGSGSPRAGAGNPRWL